MNRYIIRASKYALQLVILFFVIYLLMSLLSVNSVGLDVLLGSKGLWILGVIIIFSLLYPFFGFTTKTLNFNATENVEKVENVMEMCGFKRVESDNDNYMIFRADSIAKRISMMYEDKLIIKTQNNISTIEGNRKETFKASFRMGTYIA